MIKIRNGDGFFHVRASALIAVNTEDWTKARGWEKDQFVLTLWVAGVHQPLRIAFEHDGERDREKSMVLEAIALSERGAP